MTKPNEQTERVYQVVRYISRPAFLTYHAATDFEGERNFFEATKQHEVKKNLKKTKSTQNPKLYLTISFNRFKSQFLRSMRKRRI